MCYLVVDIKVVSFGFVVLVVVDMFNCVMLGGNENVSEDMGCVICCVDYVLEVFDCLCLFVYYLGKDVGKGVCGYSLLFGVVDVELEVM